MKIEVHQFPQGPDDPGVTSLNIVPDGLVIDGVKVDDPGPQEIGDVWMAPSGLVGVVHFAADHVRVYVNTAEDKESPDKVDIVPPHNGSFTWA